MFWAPNAWNKLHSDLQFQALVTLKESKVLVRPVQTPSSARKRFVSKF